jgi:glycosyltransferase involved in cell wall biosynthesis
MNEQPLVSVLCLSMNHEPYVRQAYTSVINQTYRNIEVLYQDNNSMDKTFEIADNLFKECGLPYQGFKNNEGWGISRNLNFLLKKAKGKFIALLSGDDWWGPDNLDVKVGLFIENPGYGLVYGNGYIYYEKDKSRQIFYGKEQLSGNVFRELLKGNFMMGASVVMNADAIKATGLYDENSPIEDWDMWLRIAQQFSVGYSHQPTIFSRVTGNNLSSNINFMNKGFAYIFNKYALYPEIKIAKKNIQLGQAYQLASNDPGMGTLSYILKNFQWNIKYVVQIKRCLLGMLRKNAARK